MNVDLVLFMWGIYVGDTKQMDFYTHRLVNYKSDAQDYTMQERIYYMYNSVVAQKEARIEDLKES